MNGKIIGVVVVLAILLIGGFFLMGKKAMAPEDTATTTEENGMVSDENTPSNTFTGSMRELAMRGGSYKCSVAASGTEGAGMTNMVVYVDGAQVRTDATMEQGGQGAVESHTITDGQFMYMWSSSMAQGMKMKIPEAGAGTGGATGSDTTGPNYDTRYSYDCDPWSADASVFAPPADVTFMEMSAAMQGMPTGAMPQ